MPPVVYRGPDELGVARIEIDRPEHANALGRSVVEELSAVLDRVGEDQPLVAVLNGRGRHFCAGVDLSELSVAEPPVVDCFFRDVQQLLIQISALPCFTVATPHGASYGAGADLALSCHVRIGWGKVALRFPGLQFGLLLGTRRLFDVVGTDRGLELLLSNRVVGGADACGLGLLSAHVDTEVDAAETVTRWAKVLKGASAAGRTRLWELTSARRDTREVEDLEQSLADEAVARGVRGYAERALSRSQARKRATDEEAKAT